MSPLCDLVLPCRDEAPALAALIAQVPDQFDVIVVDNGSTDGTADVAAGLGVRVVHEPVPGYGAAVHAGLLAATHEYVAFMDGDGSFDPRSCCRCWKRSAPVARTLRWVDGDPSTTGCGRGTPGSATD